MKLNTKYLTLMLLFCCACNPGILKKADKLLPQTQRIAARFYDSVRQKKFNGAAGLFKDSANVASSLVALNEDHGACLKPELEATKVTNSYENGVESNKITLRYKVLYSTGYLAAEKLVFIIDAKSEQINHINEYTVSKYKEDNNEGDDD